MRSVRGHGHIADTADLPVEDDVLGPWQASIAVKFHQIEPPELQRSNQKMALEFRKHHSCISAIRRIRVKGHAGHPENERADGLANLAMDELGAA